MSKASKSAARNNLCPECGQPPSTSGNIPGSTVTTYTCEAGHQWDRNEAPA
jgi:hypothetical protein